MPAVFPRCHLIPAICEQGPRSAVQLGRGRPKCLSRLNSFAASYDRTSKIISAVIAIIFVFVILATKSILVSCLAAVLFIVAYAYSPRRYTISEDSIIVHRLIGSVRIALDGAREARPARSDDLDGAIRLWGNGGLFGYYGLFRTSRLGKCWWYVTNRKNAVVVVTKRKAALVSPDDVEGFLAAIQATGPVSLPSTTPGNEDRQRSGLGGVGTVVGVIIAALVVAVVVFAFTYSPGQPSYTLTSTSLTIHDRFYPVTVQAVAVDVEQIRVVDIGTDPAWRPTSRTNGFANSHYRSGWFRVASGQRVRMYWANGKRLVLLPAKGNAPTVLFEAAEPENVVEELRRRWAN